MTFCGWWVGVGYSLAGPPIPTHRVYSGLILDNPISIREQLDIARAAHTAAFMVNDHEALGYWSAELRRLLAELKARKISMIPAVDPSSWRRRRA